ncbi:hypothetical protein F4679DRAFT_329282 [Xylaria curta]|nr:hypothetical protein F4679DRAFT_329282 [Xylaria curta]
MLEFYLLDNGGVDLDRSFAGHQAQIFNNHKDLLRPLENCPFSAKEVFRCSHDESFRVLSSRRWNKKHIGQKLKSTFNKFIGNCPETRKPVHDGLCSQCAAPLDRRSMQGAGHATQFIEAEPMQSTTLAIPNQVELDSRPCEPEPAYLTELPAKYSSEVSKACDSSYENSACPLTEFYIEASSSNGTENQRSTSLSGNASISQNFRTADSLRVEPANMTIVPPPHLGHSKLRIISDDEVANLPKMVPATNICGADIYPITNICVADIYPTTDIRGADIYPTTDINPPTIRTHWQPNGVSMLDTLPPGAPSRPCVRRWPARRCAPRSTTRNIFTAQPFPNSSINSLPRVLPSSMPNPQQTSLSSCSSEQELICPECDFKPIGELGKLKSYLRKHVRHVHGQRQPEPCPHCDAKFTRSDNLLTHMRRHHNNPTHKRRNEISDSVSSPSQSKGKGIERRQKPSE